MSQFVRTSRSVTIERYFAIVHPLKQFSFKKFLLVISTVCAILYNIPKFFELEKVVSTTLHQTDLRIHILCTAWKAPLGEFS